MFMNFLFIKVHTSNTSLKDQSVLYGLSSITEGVNRNSTCLRELHQLFEGINQKHFWALKVLDASGQPAPGFLWGNNLWLGSHFQCTDISNRKPLEVSPIKVKRPDRTPYDYPPFDLEFVMAYMRHNNTHQLHTQMPLENTIQLGLCVPKSCSINDLQYLINNYISSRYLKIQQLYNLHLQLIEVKILDSEPWVTLPKTIVTLCIWSISTLLIIAGTTYDVNVSQPRLKKQKLQAEIYFLSTFLVAKPGEPVEEKSKSAKKTTPAMLRDTPGTMGEVLQSFSFYSNCKALTKTRIAPDSIGSIHGIRFFSLFWVVCVHTIFYQIDFLKNVATGFRISESFLIQPISNSTYCVDSFLFLSGFVLSYTFYKSKGTNIQCKKPVNIMGKVIEFFSMFGNRYLRLTPVYLVTILLSDVLFSYYRQSSSLQVTEKPDINCPKYWWRNLLYINNFFPRSEMCLSWSWYLSVDTQFFLVSTFLLILSTICFKTAVALLVICVVISISITGYSSYAIGYIPSMDEQFAQLDAIYDFPWNRIGPYLIGVVTGYILTIKLEGKLNLKKPYLILMWIIFPLINLWIVFSIYGRQMSVEYSAVYMGISRTLWGFGLGWLIIACATNNAGIVNKFLSFRGWIPLSRLTYCGYLLNPLLIHIIYMGAETDQSSSISGFALSSFGIFVISIFIAFFHSLFFESPYIVLTKLFCSKLRNVSKSTSTS
ncbi:hypothetical protein RI129_000598 [Pyrocoelia pectoralis]|uniref:Nose resistant-to-fluoxetine protein N-terminal domain-containing protein n=1 Tax=Pyrocoelia pectoralis TaxID=417401 RepID=A0AAN7VRX6_9COLE